MIQTWIPGTHSELLEQWPYFIIPHYCFFEMKNKKNPCSSYTRGGRASSFDWLTLATLTIAVAAVVAPLSLASAENSTTTATTDTSSAAAPVEMEDQIAPVVAVLFPAFSATIGVIVFYVLSR